MNRTVGLGILCLFLVAASAYAQTGTVTMWRFPGADRMPNDLQLADNGTITVACFASKTIAHLDPETYLIIEWPVEDSPSHLVDTDEGIFYTLPLLGEVGVLDPSTGVTLTWALPTPGGSPELIVEADHGPGVVNLYITERNAGKIAAFEPSEIVLPAPQGAPPLPYEVTPTVTNAAPTSETVSPIRIPGGRPFLPMAAYSQPQLITPFREWTPPVFGFDLHLNGLAQGPDGALWFTQGFGPYLGVLIPWDNIIALYTLPESVRPTSVRTGPGERLWFSDVGDTPRIGQLDPNTGDVSLWEIPGGAQPYDFSFDEQDRVWFSDREADRMYRFDPASHTFTWWDLLAGTSTLSVAYAGEGAIWFVSEGLNAVGRLVVEN